MKKTILGWIISIGIVVLIIVSIFGMFNARRVEDIQKWNNGICSECGGDFKLKESSQIWNGKMIIETYFFECNNCGKIIELFELP